MSETLFLSRSALEAYQTCPRLYYITYQLLGHGVVSTRTSMDLADGIARHAGVGCMNEGGSVDVAVAEANRILVEQTNLGIEDVGDSWKASVLREHSAIVEAGIRIWDAVRRPVIHAQYEVLAVEKERSWQIRPGVIFEGRPDADFKGRYDSRMYAYSLKNPRVYYPSRHPDCMIDMQGRSEAWLLGNIYGHDNIGGVMMDYVFTGKEDRSEDSSTSGEPADMGGFTITDAPVLFTPKIRWTPMTRGWTKDMPDGSSQIYWRYKYPNPNYDPTLPRAKGNFKETTAGKANRIAAWEYHGGVKGWVDALLSQKFIPQNMSPLPEMVFSPATYYRQPEQIVSFLNKLVRTVDDLQEHLEAVQTPKPWNDLKTRHEGNLDYHFPQYETSCINKYGKKCRAWDICHRGAGRDPLSNGFKPRDPHHTKEAESLS